MTLAFISSLVLMVSPYLNDGIELGNSILFFTVHHLPSAPDEGYELPIFFSYKNSLYGFLVEIQHTLRLFIESKNIIGDPFSVNIPSLFNGRLVHSVYQELKSGRISSVRNLLATDRKMDLFLKLSRYALLDPLILNEEIVVGNEDEYYDSKPRKFDTWDQYVQSKRNSDVDEEIPEIDEEQHEIANVTLGSVWQANQILSRNKKEGT